MRAALLWLSVCAAAAPQAKGPGVPPAASAPAPRPADRCPVCGMFVAKYPQWVATVVWRGGSAVHFDGAKDLFNYLLQLPKYAPGRSPKEIVTVAVTEFYDLRTIDAREAHYVVGSDVLGPMGHEFVPLASAEDAADFVKEHKGARVLRFDEVGAELPALLDAGRFE